MCLIDGETHHEITGPSKVKPRSAAPWKTQRTDKYLVIMLSLIRAAVASNQPGHPEGMSS